MLIYNTLVSILGNFQEVLHVFLVLDYVRQNQLLLKPSCVILPYSLSNCNNGIEESELLHVLCLYASCLSICVNLVLMMVNHCFSSFKVFLIV